jgi:hypothetical protein
MKAMFWTALALVILGLLIGPSPLFLAVAMPEDSGWLQAGWAFLFFTVPLGLALMGIALVLTLIIGIRGLVGNRPKATCLVAIIGSVGSAVSGLLLLWAVMLGPPVTEALLLALVVLSAVLYLATLVAAFLVSRSTGASRPLPEATAAT